MKTKKIQYFTKINQLFGAVISSMIYTTYCRSASHNLGAVTRCDQFVKLVWQGRRVALSCKLKVKPCCHTEETSHTGNLIRQDETKTECLYALSP